MKIANFNLQSQRNAGHYQFLIDVKNFILKFTPQVLGIVELFNAFVLILENELTALNAITKSATTDEIEAADKNRDFTFRGLVDKARSSLKHYNAEVREAANRVMVIFDGYGNLVPKPYDEESGLIDSLIADLRNKAAADLVTLEIVDWVAELERLNNEFVTLTATRNSEEASRTELRMKEVRVKTDTAYKAIVERVNALIVVNGDANYVEFVKEMNTRIGRAQDSIAQSRATRKTDVPA